MLLKFNRNVVSLSKGALEADRSDINPAFTEIKTYFSNLERKYGEFRLIKRHPNAVWGDTLRVARGTNRIVAVPDFSQVFNILFSNPVPIDSIISGLRRLRYVKYAEEPLWVYLHATPNDPQYSQQWNLPKIQAEQVWDITQGDATIEIAINDFFDVAAAENHEDLQSKQSSNGEIWRGGHGRRVASVAAGVTNNSLGIASLGWNFKFQTWDGSPWVDINDAVDNGARVVNMSWTILNNPNPYLRESFAYALLQNVPCVASAGNYDTDPLPFVSYPAAYWFAADTGQVIAASATNSLDNFADGWNYSPGTDPINDPVNSFIDVAAPGVSVWTVVEDPNSINGYQTSSGTSFAAPHVSALCGLILSVNPTLTMKQVYNIITSTADKVGQYPYTNGWNRYMGYGRINAYQALLRALAYANKSMSANATAGNNGRRLVKDSSGKYHLVFESGITSGGQDLSEIFYRNSTDGVTWSTPVRLSNGLSDGAKTNPSIAERDGKIFVVWQKITGSIHDVSFHKSTDGGATWPGSNREVLATNVGANPPLPVIVSPAANQLMVVYRTASNLSYRTSTDDGNIWSAATAIPSTGIHAAHQSMAATTTNWGSARTALVNTNISGNGTIYYRYHKNGPDSTGWASLLKNLSQIVPGSYIDHQKPTIAPSGTAGNTRLHVVWEAKYNGYSTAIHRKATDWSTWPNVYSVISYLDPQVPSITGLANETAELLYESSTVSGLVQKVHYNGSGWESSFGAAYYAKNPSVSVGKTTAKYVWTEVVTPAPYLIRTSTETLSKTGVALPAIAYHRSIAVIDTTTNSWLEVRLNKLSVKTRRGEEFTMPFASAKEDSLTLTPANAFSNLASSPVALPADAESLAVHCQVSGQGLSTIKNAANPIAIAIVFTGKNRVTLRVPIINISADGLAETKISSAQGSTAFAGGELSVRTEVTGLGNKSSLIASLGHIYEEVETPLPKALESIAETATPPGSFVVAYPNPFLSEAKSRMAGNPSTQIRFVMKEAGLATLRVYNLNGQLVRELLNEYRPAGEHSSPWDGRDYRGITAASGVYFIRFEAGNEMRMSKVMLVR